MKGLVIFFIKSFAIQNSHFGLQGQILTSEEKVDYCKQIFIRSVIPVSLLELLQAFKVNSSGQKFVTYGHTEL